MSFKKTYLTFILILPLFVLFGGTVESVTGGNWNDGATWDGGNVPANSDDVEINHDINLNTDIAIDASGSLLINAGGRLTGAREIVSNGNVENHGVIEINKLESRGTIDNYNSFILNESSENSGIINLYSGTMTLNEEFENTGTINISGGKLVINEEFENEGAFTGDGTGGIDICNDGELENEDGSATGTVYYCTDCGGECEDCNGGFEENCGYVILPVEIIFFDSDVKDNSIILTWETGMEQNLNYFSVERSDDGKVFESITKVYPENDQVYTFFDDYPLPGINYYRLQFVYSEGSPEYSRVIQHELNVPSNEFKVYPNPVRREHNLFIELNAPPSDEVLVVLINQFGKEVYSKIIVDYEPGKPLIIKPDENLSQGIYYLIGSNNENIQNRQTIVVK